MKTVNYRKVYMQIISHAKSEVEKGLRPRNKYFQSKYFQNQYFEFHHIFPKSIFPNWIKRKSNIVPLTAREHYFCHQLLTKIYLCPEMFLALRYMNQNHKHSSNLYEKEKLQILEACRLAGIKASKNYDHQARCKKMWETRRKNKTDKGYGGWKLSEDTKRKISLARKGKEPTGGKQIQKGENWFTNGVVNIHAFECPTGFRKGKTVKRIRNQKGVAKSEHHKKALKSFCEKRSLDFKKYKESHPYITWREFLKIYKNLNFEN